MYHKLLKKNPKRGWVYIYLKAFIKKKMFAFLTLNFG